MENVFTLQKRATLAKVLRDNDTIGIIASTRQNHDTIGAALALYLALKESKKNVQVVSSKDPLVEISNLFGIDKVKKSFDSSIKQLTISFPYVEGEIEKAMYKTEDNKINVHFYAAKDKTISFSENDVKYIKKGGSPSVIFALAVSDDEIKEHVDNLDNVTLIRVSRHPKDTSGSIVYTDPGFSSVAEIVSKIIQEQGLKLDNDAAQNLIDGIVFSTHNYTHPRTSAYAFDATGFLLKKGAQRRDIAEDKESSSSEREKSEKKDDDNATPQKNEIMFETQESQESIAKDDHTDQKEENLKSAQEEKSEDFQKFEEKKIDTKEDVPSDWFEPKVFKSSKSDQPG